MKANKYTIGVIIFFGFLFGFCKKRLFKDIEVSGRILNFISKKPVDNGWFSMETGSVHQSGKNVAIGQVQTHSDGTFFLKSKAAYTNQYQYQVSSTQFRTGTYPFQSFIAKDVTLAPGQSINLGDFFVGEFTFICKVNIIPVTTSAFEIDSFYMTEQVPQVWGAPFPVAHFNAGTTAQFIARHTADYNDFDGKYQICYSTFPGGVKKDSCITIQTNFRPDTLSVTIQY